MRLTIHIGPHKTGTTALQTACAEGARVLKRNGVLYPRTNWMYPAQHRLAFALKGQAVPGTGKAPDRSRELTSLRQAMQRKPCDRIFISSEEFFTAPPDALDWLRTNLPDVEIDILAFLRRPDRFLLSCYNQKMRQPGNGFDAPIRRFLNNPNLIAPEINFDQHISTWADVFGDAAVKLETYEAGPPLARTLEHLNLAPDILPDRPALNRSVPGAVVEAMRHAKLAGLSKQQQRKLLQLANQVFADAPPFSLTNEDRTRIIGHFEPDNARLFARFGMENPYTEKTFTPEPIGPEFNLTIRDVMQLVSRLL